MCKIRVLHTNTHNLKISHSITDSFYLSLFTDLNKLLIQEKYAKVKNHCVVFYLFNFSRKNPNFIMCPGNGTVKSGHRYILVKLSRNWAIVRTMNFQYFIKLFNPTICVFFNDKVHTMPHVIAKSFLYKSIYITEKFWNVCPPYLKCPGIGTFTLLLCLYYMPSI